MILFLRRIAERISDFLDMIGAGTDDRLDRTYPWDTEFETDYNRILYKATHIKFMNPDDVSCAVNMVPVFNDKVDTTKILVPTGYNILSLFIEEKDCSKSSEYGFPYVIISTHEKDCRIVIFESIEFQLEFLRASIENDPTVVLASMQDHIRIIRQFYNKTFGYFSALNIYEDLSTGKNVNINRDSFISDKTFFNKITKLIQYGTAIRELKGIPYKSDFKQLTLDLFNKIELNESKNFIDKWYI